MLIMRSSIKTVETQASFSIYLKIRSSMLVKKSCSFCHRQGKVVFRAESCGTKLHNTDATTFEHEQLGSLLLSSRIFLVLQITSNNQIKL